MFHFTKKGHWPKYFFFFFKQVSIPPPLRDIEYIYMCIKYLEYLPETLFHSHFSKKRVSNDNISFYTKAFRPRSFKGQVTNLCIQKSWSWRAGRSVCSPNEGTLKNCTEPWVQGSIVCLPWNHYINCFERTKLLRKL